MKKFVIHDIGNAERKQCVLNLAKDFPDLKILESIRTPWIENREQSSIIGCSLSHIECLRNSNEDVLVFEDDAKKRDSVIIPSMDDIPDDCGIVLLGGETENVSKADINGYFEVFPKFWGTHAIIYRKRIIEMGFREEAYRLLIGRPMGPMDKYNGLCWESIICLIMDHFKMKILRPKSMPFITQSLTSSREGIVVPERLAWIDL